MIEVVERIRNNKGYIPDFLYIKEETYEKLNVGGMKDIEINEDSISWNYIGNRIIIKLYIGEVVNGKS